MRSRSSPDQGVFWLGKADRKPAAPRSTQARRCTVGEVAVREHELSADIPAFVVGRTGAGADVHERRRDVRGPGCSRRARRRDPGTRRSGAVSARPPRAPRKPEPSRSTPGSARTSSSVGGEMLDRRGGKARGGGLLPHVLGGVGEAGRAVHPVEARRARARSRGSPRRRSRHGSRRGRRRARRESPAPGREPPR